MYWSLAKPLKDNAKTIAPAGSTEGRDQQPVCDETPQITMGLV